MIMLEVATSISEFISERPFMLLGVKIVLAIIVGAAMQIGMVYLYAALTKEFARWLWGFFGLGLMLGAPVVAVFGGGWWWALPALAAVLLALYARVDYRDQGAPTTWVEVAGSLTWKARGYPDLKGRPDVAALAEYLIFDPSLEPAMQALAAGRLDEARKSFEDSAAAGSVAAMNNLGVLYESGIGVDSSTQMAMAMYRKAADAGVSIAKHNLAVILAADQLSPQALAELRQDRDGPRKRDDAEAFVEAYTLFASAASDGLRMARRALRDLRSRMTKEQIETAKKRLV